jgi:hypothetical protein
MTRKTVLLVVLVSVVLAGCTASQTGGTPTPETPGEQAESIDIDDLPGVSDGQLTNATTLAQANGAAVVADGARLALVENSQQMATEGTLTVGTDGSYVLALTRSVGENRSGTIDYWGNASTLYVRSQVGGQTQYRTAEQGLPVLENFNTSLAQYLTAGNFTVVNGSATNGTVTLSADTFDVPADGPLSSSESLQGHLVVDQAGQIHNLTVSGEAGGETIVYQYELVESGVERAEKPEWVGEIPETAVLEPQLSIDVENSAVLSVENTGGDRVPQNSVLSLTTNGTTYTATFETALDSEETRYAYLTPDGSLVLADEEPTADERVDLTSPVSITITTEEGYTLHSSAMGWGSASASADGSQGAASGSADS